VSYYVRRIRTRDQRCAVVLGQTDETGKVKVSRTFRSLTKAEAEAQAWSATGDWYAEVVSGRAPS
jgi:hypothetical protein